VSDEELDAILFKTGVEEDDDDEKLSPGKLFSTAIKLAVCDRHRIEVCR